MGRTDIFFVHDRKRPKGASAWCASTAGRDLCAFPPGPAGSGGSGWPSPAVLGIVGKPGLPLKRCQKTLMQHYVRPSYDNKSAKGEPAWACGVSIGPKHGRRFAYIPDVSAVEGSWRKGRPYNPKPLGPCDRRT
ncbi:hypothetical protein MHYP_G00097850 [Metynnis hypsauchen]